MRLVLGLGGNLGDPPGRFRMALLALAEHHRLLAVSRLYCSTPVGPPQPRYYNLAALLEIGTSLLGLLDLCQALEAAAGRDRCRELRWGPRPLDLDLLAAEGVVHRGSRLELPHPRFLLRAFALVPAAEVAPSLVLSGQSQTLAELARVVNRDGLECCGDLGLGTWSTVTSAPGRTGDEAES